MHAVETAYPATRVDAWAANSHCRAHYHIVAEAEPDVLCRVLNYFALQLLTPTQVSMNREADLLSIDIVMTGLSWHRAQVIGEKRRDQNSGCTRELWSADSERPQALAAMAQ